MQGVSERTIGRLSVYRRLLDSYRARGVGYVYSHELASLAGCTAAQVRRDLMVLGYSGTPTRGYEVAKLTEAIATFIDDPQGQSVALVGVGNLGRAILAYFSGRRPKLSIVAAFDSDVTKTNRLIHGCPCYPVDDLLEVARRERIRIGIITVPASEAQGVADRMEVAGIRGVLNFAPVVLRVPSHTYVVDMDITVSLEKVAFFARKGMLEKERRR